MTRYALLLATLLSIPLVPAGAQLYRGQSTVGVTDNSGGTTLAIGNVVHELTRTIVSPRGRMEQLLLRIESSSEETLDAPGITGKVRLSARPIDGVRETMPLYEVALDGRGARLDDSGLIAVDLDDGAARSVRAYHLVATGERLFETAAGLAGTVFPGASYRWRYAAFLPITDDREELLAKQPKIIGIITYAAADRVIRQIAVEADSAERAVQLRSIWDEGHFLAWVPGEQQALSLRFLPSGVSLLLPVKDDDLQSGPAPAGITLRALPALPLMGGWRVAEARPAPWSKLPAPMTLKGRSILFGMTAVRSADSVLDCGKADYAEALVPAEGLFMGAGLNATQAAGLGFAAGLAPSVTLSCDSGVFTFHRDGGGRWLFALDNVIYALERAVD